MSVIDCIICCLNSNLTSSQTTLNLNANKTYQTCQQLKLTNYGLKALAKRLCFKKSWNRAKSAAIVKMTRDTLTLASQSRREALVACSDTSGLLVFLLSSLIVWAVICYNGTALTWRDSAENSTHYFGCYKAFPLIILVQKISASAWMSATSLLLMAATQEVVAMPAEPNCPVVLDLLTSLPTIIGDFTYSCDVTASLVGSTCSE